MSNTSNTVKEIKKPAESKGLGFFEKFLSVWVILCIAVGVAIGKFLPGIPTFLSKFEYAHRAQHWLP